MKKQIAVLGLGRFGESVARSLTEMGHEVLAIDKDETRVQSLVDNVTHAVQADAREEEALKTLGIRNFDVVVISIGQDIQTNILTAILLKEMGCKYIIAKAQNQLQGKVLDKVGVDKVVYPERDMGFKIAQSLSATNILDYIELSKEHSIVELLAPSKFIGKTIGNLNLRAKYGFSVMAIKRDEIIMVAPGADAEIHEGDYLIIIGENKIINKFRE